MSWFLSGSCFLFRRWNRCHEVLHDKHENGNFWASTCVTQLYGKLGSPAEQIVDDVIHQARQYPGKHHSAPLNLVFLIGNPLYLLNCKFSGNLSSWFCLWSSFFSFPASSRCNSTRVQVRTPAFTVIQLYLKQKGP